MHISAASLLLVIAPACFASKLPVVDLGYELHQALSFNETYGTYNFSNIRYAAPPVGELRFRAPVSPAKNRSEVQTGAQGRVCPQAQPVWSEDIAPAFLASALTGTQFNQSTNISSYPYVPQPLDPRTTEDCLFLDVIAPKKIFDRVQNKTSVPKKSLAPVLVWIYGGGYTVGEKTSYDPRGLIQRSQKNGEGVVYVALNYRLGAFGWLAGDTLTANGTANAALHDQRLALEWVKENVHLFGGDSERVTVIGESAGGGSILHQITSYGGKGKQLPFQQAILQSPGWYPLPTDEQQEATLQQFLGLLNVSTVEEARKLPTAKLIAANSKQVYRSPYGTYTYGPAVDGTFVPKLPGELLLEGKFHKNLSLMVGHNSNEGLLFTPPASVNSNSYASLLEADLPDIQQNVTNYISNVLYPPVYNGTYGYTNPVLRFATTLADVVFQCNTDYLNRAFHNQTYAYLFSVPPGLHGSDLEYTFYNPAANSTVTSKNVALALQDYITSFAETGAPKSSAGPVFEKHGKKQQILNLSVSNITTVHDSTASPRCLFWQDAPYYQHS
ncbi:uncharacterized protein ACHE_10070A [Aspergillus chevalieri]|uniref:Carboxylic ester hydrolase n=1 Tax=Aspergillus chevalieri TaxID=182096 RepID=A0A7R7ZHW3_ASPCH|nr:uncharacterized protein ACHE_10070A [Aspergillus chevalieri]BCR82668.1 hypothetical protein ACHE_10070A [Aspergillus chevalieri]